MRAFSRLLTFALFLTLAAAPTYATVPDTIAREAIVLDFDTGTVLLEKNADAKMPTSSMSKTMTMYMVFTALKEGRLRLDSMLPVSEKAWRMQGSKMFVEVGKEIKVEDLIRGVIIQSGNDATIVLAEGIAGTEEAFAEAMNRTAQNLGMDSSHFANASGWPDPNHYSTARDLATLSVRLIRDFPEYYSYYAEKEFTYHNIRQMNRNPLLYKNMGVDGIKTGHAEDAGYGLMASGVMDGRRVVVVVNGLKDEAERAQESARLMDWGLRSFENVTLFTAGSTVEQAPVAFGMQLSVPLVIEKEIKLTVPRMAGKDITAKVVYESPIEAPVMKGTQYGKLVIEGPMMQPREIPLVAGADVPRLGLIAETVAKAKLLLTGGVGGDF